MISYLKLKNVGPSPSMEIKFAPRLNVITGDNGLGKSFILDVAWWALTRNWVHSMAVPRSPKDATIEFMFTTKSGTLHSYSSKFQNRHQRWGVKVSPNLNQPIPGLVLYAHVDGGFSVWDPARNYDYNSSGDHAGGYRAFNIDAQAVWKGNQYCKGLLQDWALWQAGNNASFQLLKKVIEVLSPSSNEKLTPGELRMLNPEDSLRCPTLRMPYGDDVPVVHASAGVRRILSIAYLLTWAWQEHVESGKQRRQRRTKNIIFLIDEVENHLHPQWQRSIVPALMKAVEALSGQHKTNVQVVTSTHSPLVMASVEPWFDPATDAWFDLDLEGTPPRVELRKRNFQLRGTAGLWLTSEAFDLATDRGSIEAERAILRAKQVLVDPNATLEQVMDVHAALRAVLQDTDVFWVRWNAFVEQKGGVR